jgi:hypothetical protein
MVVSTEKRAETPTVSGQNGSWAWRIHDTQSSAMLTRTHFLILVGWFASTSCARSKRDETTGSPPSSPVSHASSTARSAAEGSSISSVSVPSAGRATSDCKPLAELPKTARRDLPPQGRYDARASYLYVLSSDAFVDKEINAVIADDLADKRRSFTTSADQLIAGSGDNFETTARMAFDIKCDEAVATTTLLSIECTSYINLAGAHPNVEHFAYNFGLCSGRHPTSLALAALCKPDTGCERTVLDLIRRKLRRTLSRQGVNFLNLDDYSGALEFFSITRTGLRFFANDLPHAIASAGTIDIPFKQLNSVLRRDGPLAELLRP